MEFHQKAIYLYIIGLSSLLLNAFFQAQIVSKSMAARASPQTPLGELTALPQTPWLHLRAPTSQGGRGRKGGWRKNKGKGRKGKIRDV